MRGPLHFNTTEFNSFRTQKPNMPPLQNGDEFKIDTSSFLCCFTLQEGPYFVIMASTDYFRTIGSKNYWEGRVIVMY